MSNRTATVSEVARYLGVPNHFVYNAVRDGFFLCVYDSNGKTLLSIAECEWAYNQLQKLTGNNLNVNRQTKGRIRKEIIAKRAGLIEQGAELVDVPTDGVVCPTCRVDLFFVAGAVLVLALFGAMLYFGLSSTFS